MRYLNYKSNYGVETVDCLDHKDFIFYSDFRKELIRLLHEYRLAGMDVYISQRSIKDWKNN
jgi:hypothetical protein